MTFLSGSLEMHVGPPQDSSSSQLCWLPCRSKIHDAKKEPRRHSDTTIVLGFCEAEFCRL